MSYCTLDRRTGKMRATPPTPTAARLSTPMHGPARLSAVPAPPATVRPAPVAASPVALPGRFASLGENLRAIVHAEYGDGIDQRLVRAPHGASEAAPSDGGFLIGTEYSQHLIGSIYREAVIAQLCARYPTSSPADTVIPGIDETSRATGSRFGGVTSYWQAETDTITGSFPKFRGIQFQAGKLIALCAASGDLVADAPLFEAHIRRVFAQEMAWQLDQKILNGGSAGVPLGILNAPATISVAKDAGQAAATLSLNQYFRDVVAAAGAEPAQCRVANSRGRGDRPRSARPCGRHRGRCGVEYLAASRHEWQPCRAPEKAARHWWSNKRRLLVRRGT